MHAMLVRTFDGANGALGAADPLELQGAKPRWVLLYATEGFELEKTLKHLRAQYPGAPAFGATSFRGVFSSQGFTRGAACLVAEASDPLQAASVLRATGAAAARAHARSACEQIKRELGAAPGLILMHATPGFEERVLEGISDTYGDDVPVYGGSAADDAIAGRWQVFSGTELTGEGLVVTGIRSQRPVHGGFLGGYLPTDRSGVVTRAEGRVVHEIDSRRAAVVYNEWTGGIIGDEVVRGGSVLLKTNLAPVGRVVSEGHGLPRRVLSHPHEVLQGGSLAFFAELAVGERITLMAGTAEPLITRVGKVVRRALGSTRPTLRGGLLVFCGGCLGAFLDQAPRICTEFRQAAGDIPFVGVATFGEQGAITERGKANLHGNLMCSAVLFE
jgi:hypothetical protein